MSNQRWMSWACVLTCATAACASGNADKVALDASLSVDASRDATTSAFDADGDDADVIPDADVDEAHETDAGADATNDVDADVDDAGVEDARVADAEVERDAATVTPRSPTPACGTDLNVDNGAVTPHIGTLLPMTQSAAGDLANLGMLERTTSQLTIPVPAATRAYAAQGVTITAATLPATAHVPMSADGIGPFPLVIVLPGFQTNRTAYSGLAEHLASWGFIAVGLDTRSNALEASHDREALEVSLSIDWLLTQSAFKDQIDATKIAVAGHSKGGKVAFYASVLDARVDLVIGWDPVNAGGGPCAFDANCNRLPVAPNCAVMQSGLQHWMTAESLVIGAPPDALLNPDAHHNAVHFYRGAPSPAWLAVFNVGHAVWAANNDAPEMRLTKRTHLALLLTRFYGATGLDAQLPGGAVLGAEPLVIRHEHK